MANRKKVNPFILFDIDAATASNDYVSRFDELENELFTAIKRQKSNAHTRHALNRVKA